MNIGSIFFSIVCRRTTTINEKSSEIPNIFNLFINNGDIETSLDEFKQLINFDDIGRSKASNLYFLDEKNKLKKAIRINFKFNATRISNSIQYRLYK